MTSPADPIRDPGLTRFAVGNEDFCASRLEPPLPLGADKLAAALADDSPLERYSLEEIEKRLGAVADDVERQGHDAPTLDHGRLLYAEAAAIREAVDAAFNGATPTRQLVKCPACNGRGVELSEPGVGQACGDCGGSGYETKGDADA